MGPAETELALLHVPRLAAVATGAKPAWLWSSDGTHLIWVNAVGAAIFGAANARACTTFAFRADSTIAVQIARLAATLPETGQERLERLRGFSVRFAPLTCHCSRIVLPDRAAILVAAAEPTGPSLPLAERARRLFADDAALVVFAPDGTLLHAGAGALQQLNGAAHLETLGIQPLATAALASGHASGTARLGERSVAVTLQQLGEGESRVLMLTLPSAEAEAQAARSAAGANALSETFPLERREPLRFVWQMDADGRFAVGSDEFIALVGPRTIAACGRLWPEIAAELKLDPDDQVGRAVARRETLSATEVSWPIDDSGERLAVELSGLPVFDRDRSFAGYRGFGVCRDVARINQLLRVRHGRPIGFMPPPVAAESTEMPAAVQSLEAARAAEPVETVSPQPESAIAAANVVPFRAASSAEPKAPSLSAGERNAFRELAQELTARLRGHGDELADITEEHGADDTALAAAAGTAAETPQQHAERSLLDRVPAGILVYRRDALLYANRAFLDWSGYDSLDALAAAGGLNALFAEPGAEALADSGSAQKFCIQTRRGDRLALEGRLFALPWSGGSALALIVTSGQTEEHQRALQAALEAAQEEVRGIKHALERSARRDAQHAAAAKAEFIAKVSHEIRTPLNSMIGFAEVIMAERFGAIGNERYREYLNDIHTAGTQLVSLLNDLVDLSKVESGQLDLNFASLDLNDVTRQCVTVMQPQANRARIIIRSALAPSLSQIVADPRTVRQIVINLLSHAIRFTGPGGQVIVSTAVSDDGEAVLRVRDTGTGMQEKDIEAALDPFSHAATAPSWSSGGTGLGLPLTKALAEANHAEFRIKSAPNAGTLVEVAFPVRPLAAQ
jgi:signal transduction histidine kinase